MNGKYQVDNFFNTAVVPFFIGYFYIWSALLHVFNMLKTTRVLTGYNHIAFYLVRKRHVLASLFCIVCFGGLWLPFIIEYFSDLR